MSSFNTETDTDTNKWQSSTQNGNVDFMDTDLLNRSQLYILPGNNNGGQIIHNQPQRVRYEWNTNHLHSHQSLRRNSSSGSPQSTSTRNQIGTIMPPFGTSYCSNCGIQYSLPLCMAGGTNCQNQRPSLNSLSQSFSTSPTICQHCNFNTLSPTSPTCDKMFPHSYTISSTQPQTTSVSQYSNSEDSSKSLFDFEDDDFLITMAHEDITLSPSHFCDMNRSYRPKDTMDYLNTNCPLNKRSGPRHELIEYSFLLPNGCFMTLLVYDDAVLKDVKRELWLKYKAMVNELEQTKEIKKQNSSNIRASSRIGSTVRSNKVNSGITITNIANSISNTSPVQASNNVISVARQSLMELFKSSSMNTSKKISALSISDTISSPDKSLKDTTEPLKQEYEQHLGSLKKRSSSLNLERLNFDDGDEYVDISTKIIDESISSSFTRSLSVRERMFKGILPKFCKNGLQKSISCSAAATTNSICLSESRSVVNSKNSTNIADSETELLNSSPTFKTTASIVVPDFGIDNSDMFLDGHSNKEIKINPFIALANEDESDFIFSGVTMDGQTEEFFDDTARLYDLNLFMPVLKVVEAIGNKKEKLLSHVIRSDIRYCSLIYLFL